MLFFCLLGAGPVFAQAEPNPPAGPPASRAKAAAEKKEVRTYTLPPEKHAQAVAYSRAWYRLYFLRFCFGLAIYLALVGARVAPKFRDWAERVAPGPRLAQVGVFAPLLFVTLGVLRLPAAAYGHWLAAAYEQSVQGWSSWLWDWGKALGVTVAVGTFMVWILYGVIRRSPRRWWLGFWLASLPLIVAAVFLGPLVIEPLFYRFEPLEKTQPELVKELEKVVARGGLEIPRERMLEMKASEKLKAVNAYVSGIGAAKRVVVWDTTLAKLSREQTLAVFGHEMGHYVLHHIPKGIALTSMALLFYLFVAFHALRLALGRWGSRWGIRGPDDWASLPVLLLLASLLNFFATPVACTVSRSIEHEADLYGLEVTHGVIPDASQAAAEAHQILGETNLDDPAPPPFIRFWLYTHPTTAERIAFARSYDPWSRGQPRKFVQ